MYNTYFRYVLTRINAKRLQQQNDSSYSKCHFVVAVYFQIWEVTVTGTIKFTTIINILL